MTDRRRNQPPLETLSHFSRFLNHLAAERGFTQATVAARLRGMSPSTVSRLFRGQAQPTEAELAGLAQLFGVPVGNLKVLQVLDAGAFGPDDGAVTAWRDLLKAGGSRLLLSGATLVAGVTALRETSLAGKTLLVSLADPRTSAATPSPLAEFEKQCDGMESGWLRTAWLLTVSTLLSVARQPGCRCRLWVRSTLRTPLSDGEDPSIGHIVANDWIAVAAEKPSGHSSYGVHFFRDDGWMYAVQPLLDRLVGDTDSQTEELIWDSAWPPGDALTAKLRARIDEALAAVTTERLLTLCSGSKLA